MRKWVLLAALCSSLGVCEVFAHHSGAAFNHDEQKTLAGTVEDFRWANPHIWITLQVPNAKGSTDPWGIESASVHALREKGWTKNTLKSGDKVTITFYPKKDQTAFGELINVVLPDGRKLFGAIGSKATIPGTETVLPE